ncbi:MAG: squalene/phytoene synthase family protein, partial [Candidatus Thermoplasmatota archaeon]|nr:squalene/phytoene synthase family protein [Candidatus Thermoplasmatota archaeon]
RDIPEDLSFGRCYIPLNRLKEVGLEPVDLRDITSHETFSPIYQSLLDITQGHLDAAEQYILMLPRSQIRLKVACLLPVLIGQKTVNLLRTSKILDSSERVKVPRKTVKRLMIRSIFSAMIPGGTRRLLKKNRAK